jgi:endothelin-converting enzyme/putative endopeptidase
MALPNLFILLFLGISTPLMAESFPKILDETAMLGSIDPCEDFYQYACGTWLEKTTIPADRSSVSRVGTPMNNATDKNLNKILKSYARGDFSIPATYATKLADFYTSCINAEQSSPESIQYVKKEIAKIGLINSGTKLAKHIAQMHLIGAGPFFYFISSQSFNDSNKIIGDFGQNGFSLGTRDYYFDQSEKSEEIRQKYVEYIGKIFTLLGETENANQIAKTVFKLETELAEKALSIPEQSDPSNTNHPGSLKDLIKLTPHFDWATYLKELGKEELPDLNIQAPEFFTNLDILLSNIKLADLHNYLIWQFVNQRAEEMGGEFEKAHFAFWNTYLNGEKEMLPRWHICTKAVKNMMGHQLEEAYIKTFDGRAIKSKTEEMISQIKTAFEEDLHQLTSWIDNDTLNAALEKINLMGQKVGAQTTMKDYQNLTISSSNYLSNVENIIRFESLFDLDKIGKPVDKSEWGMRSWEVNAYYDSSNNEFVFPFGILQPPSLDLSASDGANFGPFGGGTIGHELTHGFDNNGSQFDGHGNLKNWWTTETKKKFDENAQCFVDQANAYKIETLDLFVDGVKTLEENLSDQGGVKLGMMALERILTIRKESPPWLGKFNERQQYWISYAQGWCTKTTDEALRAQMTSDSHPPEEFRVNAVLMNRPEFARDFNCKAGSKMAPVNRCSLW